MHQLSGPASDAAWVYSCCSVGSIQAQNQLGKTEGDPAPGRPRPCVAVSPRPPGSISSTAPPAVLRPPRPGLLHCAPPGAVAGPPELAMLACVQAARAHGPRPRATRKTPTRLKGPSCDATGHTWRGGRRGAEVAGVSAAPLTQPGPGGPLLTGGTLRGGGGGRPQNKEFRRWRFQRPREELQGGGSASTQGRRLGPAKGWGQEDASASSREWGPKGFAPQLQTASEDPRSHAGGLAPITTSRTSRVRWFLWNLNPLHVAVAAANFPAKNKTYSSTKASTWAPSRAGLGSRPPPPRGTPHESGCSRACSSFFIFWT